MSAYLGWASLVLFSVLVSAVSGWTIQETQDAASGLSIFLHEEFSKLSHCDTAEKGLNDKVGKKLSERPADIREIAKNFKKKLGPYLKDKVEALRRIVETAEAQTQIPENVEHSFVTSWYPRSFVDLREFQKNESLSEISGVHIPVEVFVNDSVILRDIDWTGSEELGKTFQNNAVGPDRTVFRQYIATETGITRIFPARNWKLDPPLITVDLFDPRFRPWYTAAVTAPKNVLFVLDYSGSVSGQTLQLMNITVQTILSSLTPNDYIKAIWYSKSVGSLLQGCFDKFMPATSRNKVMLQRHLAKQVPKYQANFPKALNYSFLEFEKFQNQTDFMSDINYGSGGHKIIILMTDGTEEWAEEVVNKFVPIRPDGSRDVTIRVFGLAMGFGITDIPALYWLSCVNKGYYSVIDSVPDIKREARSFIPVLSRTLALSYQKIPVEERPISWSGPYMDAQGEGALLTISMPILNKLVNGSKQTFMGVAAIDIKLSAIKTLVDDCILGPESYLFASDNNGHVLFHPKYKMPEPDLQLIRRTACFNVFPKQTHERSERVMFGSVNEAILRQVGLIDSTETLDISELEPNSTELGQLRTAMINNECDGSVFKMEDGGDGVTRSYTCFSFEDIPISFAVATLSSDAISTEFVDSRSDVELMAIPVWHADTYVQTFVAPKSLCSGDLDLAAVMTENRFLRFNESWHGAGTCPFSRNDFATRRILPDFEAVEEWSRSWGTKPENASCGKDDEELYRDFEKVVTFAFVQTDGGLTVVYRPPCQKVEVPHVLKTDPWRTEYYQTANRNKKYLNFNAERHHVSISKAVQRLRGEYVLGVVGINVLQGALAELLGENKDLQKITEKCELNDKSCYIITTNLSVVLALNTTGDKKPRRLLAAGNRHLGVLEPALFEHLLNTSVVSKREEMDFQASCPFYSHFTSAASRLQHMVFSILRNLFAVLATLYGLIWEQLILAQPAQTKQVLSGENKILRCEYIPPSGGETCILKHFQYTFDGRGQTEGSFGDARQRYFYIAPVKMTNLFFLVVDRGCEDCSRHSACKCFAAEPLAPERISECKATQLRYRRRPQENYETFHEEEDNTVCCGRKTALNLFLACFGVTIWIFLNL